MQAEKAKSAGPFRKFIGLFRKGKIDSEPGQRQQEKLNERFLCLFKEYYLDFDAKKRAKLAHEKLKRFEKMLAQGADPKMLWEPLPLIFHAAYHEDEAMLRLLLKHGADPNSKDDDGTAVLAWAGNNDSRICTILREHGAK